jgi:hypothetical protein
MMVVVMIPAIVVIVIAVRAVMMVMMPPTVMVMVIRSSVPDGLACRQWVIRVVGSVQPSPVCSNSDIAGHYRSETTKSRSASTHICTGRVIWLDVLQQDQIETTDIASTTTAARILKFPRKSIGASTHKSDGLGGG